MDGVPPQDPGVSPSQKPGVPPPKKEEEGYWSAIAGKVTQLFSAALQPFSGATAATPPASLPEADYTQVIRKWAEQADGSSIKSDYKKAEVEFLGFIQDYTNPKAASFRHNTIKLESLNITSLPNIWHFPVVQEHLKALWLLDCTSLKVLPEGVGQLQKLEIVDLRGCTSLEALPTNGSNFSHLQTLSIIGCKALKLSKEFIESLEKRNGTLLGCKESNILP